MDLADWLPDYIEHVEARINFAYGLRPGYTWLVDVVPVIGD